MRRRPGNDGRYQGARQLVNVNSGERNEDAGLRDKQLPDRVEDDAD
jgi:hypothetical protein